ncbi:MAG: hypothetical protein QNJ64_00030 [Crocosphaera sp.]|nr:hypothetical protein [Crocosphaera sp.]
MIDYDKQGEVASYIKDTIEKYLESSTEEEIIKLVYSLKDGINIENFFPELSSIIDTTKISLQRIIKSHVDWAIPLYKTPGEKKNFVLNKEILSIIMISDQNDISNSEKLTQLLRILASSIIDWSLDEYDIKQIVQFFDIVIEKIDIIYKQSL